LKKAEFARTIAFTVGDNKAEVSSGQGAYAFGQFVVDRLTRRLWREGRLMPITSKTFDVLVVLLEQREHTVTKDELLNRVWPDTAVNENNLARQISSLRRALGQRPDEHDFVVTIPGHGYRFVAAVQDLPGVPSELLTVRNGDAHLPPESGAEPGPEPIDTENPRGGDEAASDQPLPVATRDHADPVSSIRLNARWMRWMPLGPLAATACGVVAAAVVMTLMRPADPQPQPRRTLQRITYDEAALPRDAAWAPDGQWVVYAKDRAGNADLWKQRLGDPDPVRLTTSEPSESQPQWSPDGQSIVFRSERDGGGLYVIPADGGSERIVSTFGYDPVWSPDGTRILFKRSVVLPDSPTIYVVGLDGKPPRPLRPDVLGQFSALHAAWHPDGLRISIWGSIVRKGELQFLTVPLDAGRPTRARISARVRQDLAKVSAGRFVWAQSRRHIYFEARADDTRNVWRVTVDPQTEEWVEGPERLTTGAGEETNVAISPDGTRLVFTATSSRTRLWAFPFDTTNGRVIGEPYPISDGNTGEVDFDARADGSKVAYRTVRAGRNELWERSVIEGRERLLLSSTDWRLAKPLWSPDGARLAFSRCATRDNTLAPAVAVLNTDGSGQRVLTLPDHVEMQGSDWSKDGQAILGACRFSEWERYSTCLVPVSNANEGDDSIVRVIASDPKRNLYNQRFSPNQRWITFLAHDLSYASTSTIYVTPTTGGAWRAITDGTWFDDKPRWGPDGRILYFVSNRTGVANVWGRRFDDSTGAPIGDPFPVTSFRSAQFLLTPRTVQMDIAITATQLLLPMTESRSEIWMLDQVDR
jgi:Tol biopolymer transport system component/DNA-binding winged helix-turn-helix (wHTH) protein